MENYVKLPGRRRSLWNGSSLWMGSDHILLVRTHWFREEYRRFHLRDIQAIVTAKCPNYFVSGPMVLLGIAWLFGGMFATVGPPGSGIIWLIGALAMVATWLGLSLGSSCRCRLYTAVSSEELPSLYRTWTARRFLETVRPQIEAVQGSVSGDWAQAEASAVGPAIPGGAPEVSPGPMIYPEQAPAKQIIGHTWVSDVLVVSLLVAAIEDFLTVRMASRLWTTVAMVLLLVQLSAAVAVLIQSRRRAISTGLKNIAMTALILLAVMFYIQNFTYTFVATVNQVPVANKTVPAPMITIHYIEDAILAVLGLIGAALTVQASGNGQTDIIKD